MGPRALAQVLRQVDFPVDKEKLLVGLDSADDACVYKLNEQLALIQTVDFFTPVVDDPYLFGQIAAANAISDVYAMGGKPITAMNIVGFPSCLDNDILVEILRGGADKAREANITLSGGHTVVDDEPKYGLAVTGLINPNKLVTNAGLEPGDLLILTKPLGMGVMISAIKGGLAVGDSSNPVVAAMLELNDKPLPLIESYQIKACTDITGFGLIGHLLEMAEASNLQINLTAQEVPFFAKIKSFAAMGLLPAGAYANRENFADKLTHQGDIDENLLDLLFDPQTSGGLVIAVKKEQAADFLLDLYQLGIDEATVIGSVKKGDWGIQIDW